MRGDFGFDLCCMRQCLVPADLQFASHQPIGGVGGIVLSEGTVGGMARCFEVSAQHLAHLVPQPASRRFAASVAAVMAPGPTTRRSASSIASSTRNPAERNAL